MTDLITSLDRGVLTVRINRPERLNAISQPMRDGLLQTFEDAASSDEVNVLVLTGTGDRAFCAGRDLKEFHETLLVTERGKSARWDARSSPWEALLNLGKPTVAAVNGLAAGGGLELLLACDLRIAVRGAVLGLPEVKRGMAATFGSVFLFEALPRALAYEMCYSGRLVPVEELHVWGLFNRVVDTHADLAPAVQELVESLGESAPLALRRYKEIASTTLSASTAALRAQPTIELHTTDDVREGIRAFVEKRDPRWSHA